MKPILTAALTMALMLTSILGAASCSKPYSGPVESVTLADLSVESSALIYIAQDQGYFSANGLNITLKSYDNGVAAANAMLNGEADIAAMTEFVMARDALDQKPMQILTTMNRSLSMSLVCLNSRGIAAVPDLAGKRIGLTRGTIAEFYLGRFLDLHAMSIKEVTLVDLPQTQWLNAITSGAVDAVIGWAPYVTEIQKQYQSDVVSFQPQSEQPLFSLIGGRNDWISTHQEAAVRFLKALDQAESFLHDHPAEARSIIQKKFNYDDTYMDAVWPAYTFSISLNQALIVAMEDEARWLIVNNLTAAKQVPDFLNYISESSLKSVKSGSVNIIR